MEDFEKAKDKIFMGAERKSMIITPEDKRKTAYHESGHAIIGSLLPGYDPVHGHGHPRVIALSVCVVAAGAGSLRLYRDQMMSPDLHALWRSGRRGTVHEDI